MGTIVKRGEVFRAVVRLTGKKPQTKSFATKREASIWISAIETGLREAIAAVVNQHLDVSAILLKHRDEVLTARGYHVNLHDNTRFANEFAGVEVAHLTHEWWVNTVKGWKVKPQSAKRYVGSIVSALHAAEDLKWGVTVNWAEYHDAMKALGRQRLIAVGRSRKRRISEEEIRAIKAEHSEAEIPLADIIDFAVLTAMRVGEICRITWADLDQRRKMQMVRDRKDPKNKLGNDSEVPLMGAALDIIKRQPRSRFDDRIFPWVPRSVAKAFTVAAKVARVKNVHFHDLRHEGITRLFEQGFGVEQVCLVSGHKTWEQLREYTELAAESLHAGPLAHRRAA